MTFTGKLKPTNKVTCPKCEGEGWYINVITVAISDIIIEKEFDMDCELCDSLGYIESENDNARAWLVSIH